MNVEALSLAPASLEPMPCLPLTRAGIEEIMAGGGVPGPAIEPRAQMGWVIVLHDQPAPEAVPSALPGYTGQELSSLLLGEPGEQSGDICMGSLVDDEDTLALLAHSFKGQWSGAFLVQAQGWRVRLPSGATPVLFERSDIEKPVLTLRSAAKSSKCAVIGIWSLHDEDGWLLASSPNLASAARMYANVAQMVMA